VKSQWCNSVVFTVYIQSLSKNCGNTFKESFFPIESREFTKLHKFSLIFTGCSTWIVPFLISNFYTVNIILLIWEFNQFLYMLLGVLSQNVIGMGWKMNDLRMSISTWVKFNSAPLDVKKTSYFYKFDYCKTTQRSPKLCRIVSN